MALTRAARTRAAAILVILVLLLAMSPLAVGLGFGESLTSGSPDAGVELKTISGAAFCYVDGDGRSGFGFDDSLILGVSGCGGTSSSNDLRLKEWNAASAGDRLRSGTDSGKAVSTFTGSPQVWYHDANGNGDFDEGDTAYANVRIPEKGAADVADVRLTAFGSNEAGTAVRSGDPDLGLALTLLGPPNEVFGYADLDGDNQVDSDEPIYLNADEGGAEPVEAGDVRLSLVPEGSVYGSFVTAEDPESVGVLQNVVRPVCYADDNGSGTYTAGEPLYLDLDASCAGTVAAGDLRLDNGGERTAGTRVASGDADIGMRLAAQTSAKLSYLDQDGTGTFTWADVAFIDLLSTSENLVDRGDLQLSPTDGTAGGTAVPGDDVFRGRTLAPIGDFRDHVAFVQRGSDTQPTRNSQFYLNIDKGTNEPIEVNDIRLGIVGDLPFGGTAHLATGEAAPRITRASATACFLASSSSDTYRSGDPVYVAIGQSCGSSVKSGFLRMTPFASHPAGTTVQASDNDVGNAVQTANGATDWMFYDRDGDSSWSAGDFLYLDLVSPNDDRVDIGDIRVTPLEGADGGNVVASGDSDASATLVSLGSLSARTAYVDVDEDRTYGPGDIAYVDRNGQGDYATLLDVRLGTLPDIPTPEPPSADNDTSDPTDNTTDDQDQPTDSDDQDQPTDSDDQPTDSDDDDLPGNAGDQSNQSGRPPIRTPGPSAALATLALLGLVLWSRRR